jgi:uncharacterized protein YqhQ
MTDKHLDDIEIQQIALNDKVCPVEVIAHYNSCDECKVKATQYALLFVGIKQLASPAFEFDLSKLVMKELLVSPVKSSFDHYFVFSVVAVVSFFVACTTYLFRTYVADMFASITPISIYLILITVVSVLFILSVDIISRFHKQMKVLNYY